MADEMEELGKAFGANLRKRLEATVERRDFAVETYDFDPSRIIGRIQERDTLRNQQQVLPEEQRMAAAHAYAQGMPKEMVVQQIGEPYRQRRAEVDRQLDALDPVSSEDRKNAIRAMIIPRRELTPGEVFEPEGLNGVNIKLPQDAQVTIERIRVAIAGESARYRITIDPRDMPQTIDSENKIADFNSLSVVMTGEQLSSTTFRAPGSGRNHIDLAGNKASVERDLNFHVASDGARVTYDSQFAGHVTGDASVLTGPPPRELTPEEQMARKVKEDAIREWPERARILRQVDLQEDIYDHEANREQQRRDRHGRHYNFRYGGRGGTRYNVIDGESLRTLPTTPIIITTPSDNDKGRY